MNARTLAPTAKYTDFDVPAVEEGRIPLTDEQRDFLILDTPRFEEGMSLTVEYLAGLTDYQLIREAYDVWAAYAQGQV